MTPPVSKPPIKRRRWPLGLLLALIVALLLAGWYLNSDRFHRYVEAKVVERLQQATGGRAEIGKVQFRLSRLHFEIEDVTVHGNEAAGEPPFAHVDRIVADMRVLSVFGGGVGLRELELERPMARVQIDPDGTTNLPAPRLTRQSQTPVEQLFEIGARRFIVRDGVLQLNDRKIPLSFEAQDTAATLFYARLHGRYDGAVSVGRVEAHYRDSLPVSGAGKLDFSLFRDKAELKSFEVASGTSHLSGKGEITDFRHPAVQLDYRGTLNLRDLGRTARMASVRDGTLELNGTASYTAGGYAATGKLAVRGFEGELSGRRVSGVSGRADYTLGSNGIRLSNAEGTAFGGSIKGDFQLTNAAVPKGAGGAAPRVAKGSAHLRLSGASLDAILKMFAPDTPALQRMHFVGSVSGTIESTWTGSPRKALAGISLEVAPPAHPAPGEEPVTAVLRAIYHGAEESLEVSQFNFATPALRAAAGGAIGSQGARLNVSLNSGNIGELTPLMAALDPSARLPEQLRGRASFNGTATGKLRNPTISGLLEVDDFDAVMPPASPAPLSVVTATSTPLPSHIRWDHLRAEVDYSPSEAGARHGEVTSGKATASFDFSALLRRGQFLDGSPFTAHFAAHNAQVTDLEALAGWNFAVTGTTEMKMSASGTKADPRAEGTISITDGTLYSEPFHTLRGELSFAQQEAALKDIALSFDGAQLAGTAGYNVVTHAMRFDVEGSHFNLAEFRTLQRARLRTTGTLSFTARGSGTTEAPVINASLHLRDVVLNGERVGEFDADAVTRGADLQILGGSKFDRARLALTGTVHMREDWPANIALDFTDLDFDPLLLAFLEGRLTGHSSMAGKVTIAGPLKEPKLLNVRGDIPQLSVNVSNVVLHNDGPVRFAMDEGVVRVQQFRIVGEGTDFSAGGAIALTAPGTIEVRADGVVNLRLLQTFDRGLISSGMTTLAVQVGGTTASPDVQGEVDIKDGAVSYIDLPNGLTNVNGRLVFNQNRLVVQTLSARTGGGDLALGGFISYARGLYFNLTASGREVRLRYPQGISSTASADLHFQGTSANSLLSGDVVVTRFGMNPEFDVASYLAKAKEPPAAPAPGSPLNNLHLDVHITSTPELQLQSTMARLSGQVDLHVRGTALHPVVLGRVDISAGEISFAGTKYHIDRGDLVFANPVRIEPVVDVEASARVRDYDITLGFHGPLDRMATNYRSDPPLPPGDIIALLALGRTQEEAYQYSTEYQSTFTENASNAILDQALNQAMSNRMQKLFGVSRIKIDPQVGGPENNPNARLTIEQQVSDKVTLTYITNLAQSQQQIIQVEYSITPNLSVVAIRDQNGVVGMDVRLRRRRR